MHIWFFIFIYFICNSFYPSQFYGCSNSLMWTCIQEFISHTSRRRPASTWLMSAISNSYPKDRIYYANPRIHATTSTSSAQSHVSYYPGLYWIRTHNNHHPCVYKLPPCQLSYPNPLSYIFVQILIVLFQHEVKNNNIKKMKTRIGLPSCILSTHWSWNCQKNGGQVSLYDNFKIVKSLCISSIT